jgi:hypothetical protein
MFVMLELWNYWTTFLHYYANLCQTNSIKRHFRQKTLATFSTLEGVIAYSDLPQNLEVLTRSFKSSLIRKYPKTFHEFHEYSDPSEWSTNFHLTFINRSFSEYSWSSWKVLWYSSQSIFERPGWNCRPLKLIQGRSFTFLFVIFWYEWKYPKHGPKFFLSL